MTTCLGKSCSFGLPRMPFVNCCQLMYLVISLLVLRAGCGIWLYQFLIIAHHFTLNKFYHEDQTGFISGRFIGENIRLLNDVIDFTEKKKKERKKKKKDLPGVLLLINFEKAFDSGSLFSCVIVNGHLSDWFYLQRGCRHWDPLSPYLFILCAEIFTALIRNNKDIKGIQILPHNICYFSICWRYDNDTRW